ncbi:hypothetical protein CYY_008022 [Polysphondylium violaceum]|uniref:Uncharacterized protein n=1 Tax=Polysphondylium violaceum TaxID=133409 RepID=A0A8J4PNT3_9MYCE|nr:hypothetical protein CYY_008022 [Polysphondylium violaceum]
MFYKSSMIQQVSGVINTFNVKILEMAIQDQYNVPIMDYLTVEKYLDVHIQIQIQDGTLHTKHNSKDGFIALNLYHFIYLAHSIFIDPETSTSSMTLIEFISRNQDGFNGNLQFTSLYYFPLQGFYDGHDFNHLLVEFTVMMMMTLTNKRSCD